MVLASSDRPVAAVVEIPLNRIKVTTRLRSTDYAKVTDIAESVLGVGLLHAITVSKHGDSYLLLSGMHRLEAFRKLKRTTIPATVKDADPLIEELIEVEENPFRHRFLPLMSTVHVDGKNFCHLGRRASRVTTVGIVLD